MDNRTIGNTVTVCFVTIGNKKLEGKVDTGATTSSLHASDIKVSDDKSSVSFRCSALSDGVLTVPLDGAQTVHTSDNGGEQRPVVRLNIDINGVSLTDITFNLNDRSGMDSPLLIGQNVLKPGEFIVDVNKDESIPGSQEVSIQGESVYNEEVMMAVRTLVESQMTIADLIKYMRTEAITTLKND